MVDIWKMRKAYKILVGKAEEKIGLQLERPM
jgi:hypothetical protein